MRIKFFDQKNLLTYSQNLSLKLNEDVENYAQVQIYKKGMANESDLTPAEKINSVINSLVISNSVDFKRELTWAIEKWQGMPIIYYADFRLTSSNYEKVNILLEWTKPYLKQYMKKGVKIGAWDEEKSIIINSILVLFKEYDMDKDTLRFIGIETKEKEVEK